MKQSDYIKLEKIKQRAVKDQNYYLAGKIRDAQNALREHLNYKWTDEILKSIEND